MDMAVDLMWGDIFGFLWIQLCFAWYWFKKSKPIKVNNSQSGGVRAEKQHLDFSKLINSAISRIWYSVFVLHNMQHMRHLSLSPELAVSCFWPQRTDRGSRLSFKLGDGNVVRVCIWWLLNILNIFCIYSMPIKNGRGPERGEAEIMAFFKGPSSM